MDTEKLENTIQKENLELKERSAITFVHDIVDFEAIHDFPEGAALERIVEDRSMMLAKVVTKTFKRFSLPVIKWLAYAI